MLKKIVQLLCVSVLFLTTFRPTFSEKNTLIIAQNSDAKSLDPHVSNDVPTHRVVTNIYDSLIQWNENHELEPAVAQSWKQIDPLTLEFKIRPNIKFHNGEPLKMSDIKFSLERAKNAPALMTFFSGIDTINIIDDNTIQITTKKPYGPLINYLAHEGAAILNEKVVTEAGKDYGQNPVGTGPYKFQEWKAGDRVILTANKDYFLDKPKSETLVFRVVPEGGNRVIALETGEIDLAYDIDPINLDTVRHHGDLKLYEQPAMGINYLGFNTTNKVLGNVLVRQAIAKAIDLDSIVEAVYLGAAQKANSPVSPSVFGYNKDTKAYEQNIAEAKELLKKAGYSKGIDLKLWTNDNSVRRDIAVILQDQLKAININLNIEILEWGAYLDQLLQKKHDLFLLGWASSPDSDSALYALFHSKNHGSSGNRSYYDNKKVDKLLDLGRESTNPEDRKKYYYEAQGILQEEIPLLTLAYPYDTVGANKSISNFNLNIEKLHKVEKNR
ncbi:peptide/nickel transport system substrate-binding protein [Cetobacterium ceti]|uniref:Peptide/nickel transport system substrate-binding protein n=1 Tax=Cetobacterium ceti TaxID=180163 RepID=A0A1T4NAX0_9FUSO|nr:ABC transporter substrate-binding protein [Cetobacterium ceti]SJZ76429.1 peptide/nickel transport system substrate-binding protein [Cetobacterium ceti]